MDISDYLIKPADDSRENTFRFKVGDHVSFLSTAIPQHLLEIQGIPFTEKDIEEREFKGTIRQCYTLGSLGNCYDIISDFWCVDCCVMEEKVLTTVARKTDGLHRG